MITTNTKYKVLTGVPGVVDTGVVVTTEADRDDKDKLVIGKTGMIFCKIEPAGSIFLDEGNLEPIK